MSYCLKEGFKEVCVAFSSSTSSSLLLVGSSFPFSSALVNMLVSSAGFIESLSLCGVFVTTAYSGLKWWGQNLILIFLMGKFAYEPQGLRNQVVTRKNKNVILLWNLMILWGLPHDSGVLGFASDVIIRFSSFLFSILHYAPQEYF